MKLKGKTHDIIFKTYSKDVLGYIVRMPDCIGFIVINSILPGGEAKKAYKTLEELAAKDQQTRFILLQGDGQVYKTDNLELPEMRDAV